MAGPFAWLIGEPGQVGNEAAIAVPGQCRSKARLFASGKTGAHHDKGAMSYLVLARKWRPRDFESLVGQDHVVRALTHALSSGRLHHAWLFTGTRGVGKTTLSRILAKSLNCETGITATPCGQCRACTEIDQGRFVDYVELDAASNRGVDEMTQLLEQAVYSPAIGRFKVYMIDEVHMLSGHAFNAMLKTLEEPPPHVKFILATTDPQKIPPTVLSRCLQFNLKQMAPQSIAQYLEHVLSEEQVPFELPALTLIGKAAAGSMRDALSLTDQAIAYSKGSLSLESVRTMLGSVDQTHLLQLLQALAAADARAVVALADQLSSRAISLRAVLADLAVLLSRLAIEQRVASDPADSEALEPPLRELAATLPADLLQLFYTVAVHGRQEMVLAPDEYAGFVMVCLKMLSFVDESERVAPEQLAAAAPSAEAEKKTPQQALTTAPPPPPPPSPATQAPTEAHRPTRLELGPQLLEQWPRLAAELPLSGMAQQLATQSACQDVQQDMVCLVVPTQALTQGSHVKRLAEVLSEQAGYEVKLQVSVGDISPGSSAQSIADAQAQQRQQAAEQIVSQDSFVKALIEDFGGHVVPGSIKAT